MAAAGLGDHLTCSICLSIYTDPVSLPCGHNFCQGCIGRSWDSQEGSGAYSCPECRAGHPERPALQRNRTLGNIAEQFLSTHPEHDGTETSGNRRCSAHKKILEYYCPKDGTCVCVSCCLAGEHRGHKVELLSEASQRQRQTLRKDLRNLNLGREVNERGAQRLQERIKEVESKAAGETERVAAYFRDIRERMEAFEAQLTSDISGQKERLLQPFTSQISQLERETDELSKRIHDIEELSYIRDPLTFLQALKSAGVVGTESGGTGRGEIPIPNVGDMDVARVSDTLVPGLAGIVQQVIHSRLYGQRATNLLLDSTRAGANICVSEDRKYANYEDNFQQPNIPEKYKDVQVLSTRIFTSGRHYWDVMGSESGNWWVGVAYPSIEKKGEESCIGNNNKFWCLHRRRDAYSVRHNSKVTDLRLRALCSRIRVSLDYEAGRLSFYELSEPIRHLHTYTAQFTEPLHAAFWVWRWKSDDVWVNIIS
ncbi:hypothetical protein XENTR_v10022693 [Xenopus tropicalis]|uniref:E3 ubiquitin-protein ligase TRIM7 n=1 Tax=Xenopus tropicalis TaxID=8364 RepID=A0A8J0SZF3_XENTR|nr:E3 ubiquitin-protein ligase TRIM7 [Xenopus tropicalis]KAE8588689.1 hypothetical protein XENTR_v10022693 [Xenopus tropicalis]